ncbi:MAG: hypothetical protein WDW21_01430 [Neisseriaceae bacterium]
MLTYIPPEKKSPPKLPKKPWLLVCLTFIWLWTGIIGKNLWDNEELQLYSYVGSILDTHQWLLPTIYGVPYLSSSPLFLWLGAISKWFFTQLGVSNYLAIRLLTLFLMSFDLFLLAISAKNFLGRYQGRLVVLITIGCIGIIIFGHQISSLPLLLLSLALYSYAISQWHSQRIFLTGFQVALSWTIAFYTQNLPPLILLVSLSLLLLLHPSWRTRPYYLILLVSFAVFLPLASLWLSALYVSNPSHFYFWLANYSLGAYGGLKNLKVAFAGIYYLKNMLWYAFPAWLIAAWALTKLKAESYRNPTYFFFLLWLILGFLLICFQEEPANNQLIFIIPPLTFLAAVRIDLLKRGWAAFLNWLGIAAFGSVALFIWLEYFAINLLLSKALSERASYFNPHYVPHISIFSILIALAFTPIWLYAVSRKRIEGRQAINNWATGVTFIWLLNCTLFLSWWNTNKAHQPLVSELEHTLPTSFQKKVQKKQICVDSDNLEALIIWNQYGHFPVYSAIAPASSHCRYHLSLGSQTTLQIKMPIVKIIYGKAQARRKNRFFIIWKS